MTLFDASIMVQLAQRQGRDCRTALVAAYQAKIDERADWKAQFVAAYQAQVESERALANAFAYLRDLNAMAA